jgi:hypothetical protein
MKVLILAAIMVFCSGCAEVGSERWCKKMEEKPKGDWSTNEATDYTTNCIFD